MPEDGPYLATPYFANGPHVHEYLQEMNRRILGQRSFITVGEMVSVTTDQARLYTHKDRHEVKHGLHLRAHVSRCGRVKTSGRSVNGSCRTKGRIREMADQPCGRLLEQSVLK